MLSTQQLFDFYDRVNMLSMLWKVPVELRCHLEEPVQFLGSLYYGLIIYFEASS